MAKISVCRRCGGEVQAPAGTCEHCGARVPNLFRGFVKIALFVAICAAGGLLLWRLFWLNATNSIKTDPRVIKIVEPSAANPVLEIPGMMTVRYREAGDQVEIEMRASGMPILYVDQEGNGKVDAAGDGRSYAAYPSGLPCVQRMRSEETAQCGNVPSSATTRVSGDQEHWSVEWTIPKREISVKEAVADVVFGVFREKDQRTSYYPDHPFAHVYRLNFSAAQGSVQSAINPPASEGRALDAGDKRPVRGSTMPVRDAKSPFASSNVSHFTAHNNQPHQTFSASDPSMRDGDSGSLGRKDASLMQANSPTSVPGPTSDSGEIFWSGQIDPTGRINIGSRANAAEVLRGSLPGVPVDVEVFPKTIRIVEGPSRSNDYKGMVLGGPVGEKITVLVRWTRAK
jgi:hypothetical protein